MKKSQVKHLSKAVEEVTRPIYQKNGIINYKMIANWDKIVGVNLAKICVPTKITFPGEEQVNGELYVEVENPGFGLEIQSNQFIILQKLSTYFGYKAVSKIKIKVAPHKTTKEDTKITVHTQKIIGSIKDEDIENAMLNIEDPETQSLIRSIAGHKFNNTTC